MIFDGVQFNYQTYAALLDSLERTKGKGYLTNEEWQMEVTETVRAIQGKVKKKFKV